MLSFKIGDIDFENSTIILKITKNRKQQIIPITNSLLIILNEYLKYRKGKDEDYLFCNIYGGKLHPSALESAIKKYNLKRGVNKTSLHLYRHTFAKKWILKGGDIFRLQKILGHSSLEMVKQYVNMFSDDLKIGFSQFNPLEDFSNIGKKSIKIK